MDVLQDSQGNTNSREIAISFVVPCHNEAGNIEPLAERIAQEFCDAGVPCEIVFIDDGSTDNTLNELRSLTDNRNILSASSQPLLIKVASLSRNFGKESALYAGMKIASGPVLCFIDADMQQDPHMAREMYDFLIAHDEYDVVAGYQDVRTENKLIAWLKENFYRVFNATSDEIELPANMSDFRVFRRIVANALLSMPEHFRFSKGLFAWVGFSTYAMPYTAQKRNAGKSSWNLNKLFRYAFAGITSFSTWPLKALKYIGGIVALFSMVYLLWVVIVDYLICGISVPGYATLVCLILLFGGIQVAAIGVLGDYMARSYVEGKRRPLYIIREEFSKQL